MTKSTSAILLLCLISVSLLAGINDDKKRAEEIRSLMWNKADSDFAVTAVPDKWNHSSAVILARAFTLTYRKLPVVNDLSHDNYAHYRIKLLDAKALEKYAQFTLDGSGSWGNTRSNSYAGFKIIKPDGREIEIPLSLAVKESKELNRSRIDVYKLAIPNLELGDILDYYIAEEKTISVYLKYYTFDPEIFILQSEYPILKQKISFDVLRRCFINATSINGAPQLKLNEDAEKEKNHYYLEDTDREGIQSTQWVYPYREMPTIKFKVTYASSMVAAQIPGFMGSPGIVKSKVEKSEVTNLFARIYTYPSLHSALLKSLMNKQFKGVKDQNKLAREAFYGLRHVMFIKGSEARLASGYAPNQYSTIEWTKALSAYYRAKKISHELIIGTPRHISSLDNLIMEEELTVMLRVNTPKPFYIGDFGIHAVVDEINSDLQGESVFAAHALGMPSTWILRNTKIPVVSFEENLIESHYTINIADLSDGIVEMNAQKSCYGSSRHPFQRAILDYYDYKQEESKHFSVTENQTGQIKTDKRLNGQRDDYLSRREDSKKETLKKIIEGDFDLETLAADSLFIVSTGRFNKAEPFSYKYHVTFKGAVKKAGPNYLIDIGKFIENQIQLKEEDRSRNYNVYMPFARSFRYNFEISIPEGFSVQGIEKLNTHVENQTGGFKSQALLQGNKIKIEVFKHYKSNFEKNEHWNQMTEFLDAAFDFSQQQLLLQASNQTLN
jgi:hypothetical protein